jgi:MacB-like periplasmic core domain
VAVSLLLLAGAGFFVRSFENSARTDMGFRVDHTLMASMDLRLQDYTEQRGQQFYEQLRDRVKARRGVRDAAISALIPMGYDTNIATVYTAEEAATEKGKGEIIFCNSVQPEYFRTLGVRVVRGREFTRADSSSAPRVAIVNDAFVKKIFPGQDPLGKTFQTERSGPEIQIVGVTGTGKYMFLYEPAQPFIYFPLPQKYQSSATLLVYSEGDPEGLVMLATGIANANPIRRYSWRSATTGSTLVARSAGI